jgi:hypothetical protein
MAYWYATRLRRFFLKMVALKYLTRYRSCATWSVFCVPDVVQPVRQSKISSFLRLSRAVVRNFREKLWPGDAFANFDYRFNERTSSRLRDDLPSSCLKDFGQGCYKDAWAQDSKPFAFGQPYPFQSFGMNRVEELVTIRAHI